MPKHEIENSLGRIFPQEMGRITKSRMNFFELFRLLSEVKRQGWVDRGIKDPETVAEHTLQVTAMTIFEADRRSLDTQRAAKMALIHDLPEIIVGDITPHQNLSGSEREEAILYRWVPPTKEALEDKRKKEDDALKEIARGLPLDIRGSISDLWREYREGQTEEAKLVRRMDHLQCLLLAKSYWEEEGDSFPIASYIEQGLLSEDPQVRSLARKIQRDIGYVPRKQLA